MTNTTPAFRYHGTTDDVVTCEHCGRNDLARTVVLEVLDHEGNADGVVYFGTTCAARAISHRFGVTTTAADVRRGIRAAEKAAREAELRATEAAQAKLIAARDAVLRARGLDPRTARPADCLEALRAATA